MKYLEKKLLRNTMRDINSKPQVKGTNTKGSSKYGNRHTTQSSDDTTGILKGRHSKRPVSLPKMPWDK